MYSPTIEGRGRGRGRGTGRGAPPRGKRGARGTPPGRHSSYTPSNRGGTALRGRPGFNDDTQAGTQGRPLPTVGRGSLSSSSPVRPNSASIPRPQVNIPQNGARTLPKFGEVNHSNPDEPTPPPRSPRVSPRISNLPKLPYRAPDPNAAPTGGATPAPPAGGEPAKEVDPEKEKRRAELRHKCLEEIYQTEKDYIDDLETLINVFIFPMRAMAILDDKSLYNVFSNVEVLINCNKEMLTQLENTIQTTNAGDDVTIGDVFTQLADYFKMYKVFCANQQTSLTTVELLIKKHPQFKKKLEVCHTDARCRGLFLQSFLIKPIQRVCKYPLLLRELIRYTPEDHPDWEPLQSAFSKINSVVADINEAQRQAEGLQRILDLQKMIDGVESLVAPGRNYVKEGELSFYKSQKSKSPEKRHVFFFTDLIVLTNRKGEKKFEHKLSVDLDSCKLVVLADSSHIKNAFELQTGNKSKKCILCGESAEQSNQWIKEIRGLIKSYQKKKLREIEEARKKGLTPL
uniref:DH domain-containing protein n=1 Tax=Vannella robusta TaxID=1487602 RepID=A0A7S4M713_9EUKA|mmetsp:Transcript_13471/g.16980  ORF Transcript_13471/g.16980 Transcript_13471/m.16980 type:complete len:514 (+) Transcript_13471:128-1669(+)